MKKRWIGLLLAVLLIVSPVLLNGALAESVLFPKMQKQLDAGSGLKGTVTVSGLTGLEGLKLDASYILQKTQSQLLLLLKNGDTELAKAALYEQGSSLALDAGLASGKLYALSGGLDSLPGLLAGNAAGGQVSVYSALYGILFLKDQEASAKLLTAAAPYLTKADLWMQGFADAPALEKDDAGASVMKVSYNIPAAAMKAELKQLLVDLLADKTLLPLLWSQMSLDQANLYLNPALQSFYFQAIDALPLTGQITMLRRVTTAGEIKETSLSLPLSASETGISSLSFSSKAAAGGDIMDVVLGMGKGTLEITMQSAASAQAAESGQPEKISCSGLVRYLPAESPNWQVDSTTPKYEGKALSVSYQATYTAARSVDADSKNNENYNLSIALTPDWSHLSTGQEITDEINAQYMLIDPVQITASMLVKSGQARNSATSVDAQVHYTGGAANVTITGQFKTTPPWAFTPVDTASAERLGNLTQDQLNAILTEILGKPGLLQLVTTLLPVDAAAPGTVG